MGKNTFSSVEWKIEQKKPISNVTEVYKMGKQQIRFIILQSKNPFIKARHMIS